MKYLIYCAFGLAAVTSLSACQDKKKAKNYMEETNIGQDGLEFVTVALEGGLMEVQGGKLALTNAANPRVKAFGQMMVTDHTKAGNQLEKIATERLVSTKKTISPEHQKMLADLSAKKGAEFDKAYMKMMVSDHNEDIALYKRATQLNTSQVKNFAKETIPVLQKHLDSAQAINTSLR